MQDPAMASPGDLELQELLDLARDKSVTGRTRLVQVVGDLFFEEERILSDRERALMTEILHQLIHDVEMSVRRALADRLADQPDAPHELVTVLANDEISVAHKILEKSLVLQDIELIEINEAFASQVLACIGELGIEEERLNVNGGAIALGHPLGCSGARLMTTLAWEMRRRGARYGIAALCVGVGQGVATVVENPAAH